MPPKKKTRTTGREPAGIPAIEDLEQTGAAALLSGGTLRDAYLSELDLAAKTLPEIRIFDSLCERASFAGTVLSSARWNDVQFRNCDFSNAVFHTLDARRVEFFDCRMTGMKASGCMMQDVLFDHCDLRYACFSQGSLEACEFVSSHLDESEFASTRVERALFTACTLKRADLTASTLKESDLRGADIEGILIQDASFRTSTITPAQAIELARLMGLKLG
jgi:uncharacterized protein YjbI with pentapeptide repeats